VPTLAQVLERVDERIPLLIELKRGAGADPVALVRGVLEDLGDRNGRYALCSFDPGLLRFLRAERARYPVGQISGLLRNERPLRRLAGRTMAGNFLTRPDFISYELAGLPSRIVDLWRGRGVPVLTWTVKSAADEQKARKYADNFIFDVLPQGSGQ
jgi:glycerophosphoryl diester phosphodiesterase